MITKRSSGILLHPTSLPGKFGIGTFGKEAYDFVDFLVKSGQKLWQILPLNHTGDGSCPYACISAFAGNVLLIDLEMLQKEGWLKAGEIQKIDGMKESSVEYNIVRSHKMPILRKAFENFKKFANEKERKRFRTFRSAEKDWLDDFCLFIETKKYFNNVSWHCWDADISKRSKSALKKYKTLLKEDIEFQAFLQYVFFDQWQKLKKYANSKGVKIIGDIPIFVSYDSSDVWSHPEVFSLDRNRLPKEVSGVPPDYFSKTGQLWGNPLYNWKNLKEQNFKWWVERIRKSITVTDIVRIDHFRGFAEYWSVPYDEKTAVNGKWKKCPGQELFAKFEQVFGNLPVIAEDLGYITPSVIALRDIFGLAGMKVLQFMFSKDDIAHHSNDNFPKNSIVYTGTHDNDTTLGWFKKLSATDKRAIRKYFQNGEKDMVWNFIRHALNSRSVISIVPLQDVLSLDSDARMNMPGTNEGDWEWRFRKGMITAEIIKKLRKATKESGR